jgi:hypothetical protein
MHINWGFWGALLGVTVVGKIMEERVERGEELAKELVLAAGYEDYDRFYAALASTGKLLPWQIRGSWVSARQAAYELQMLKDGQIRRADHLQRFRDWCRTLV